MISWLWVVSLKALIELTGIIVFLLSEISDIFSNQLSEKIHKYVRAYEMCQIDRTLFWKKSLTFQYQVQARCSHPVRSLFWSKLYWVAEILLAGVVFHFFPDTALKKYLILFDSVWEQFSGCYPVFLQYSTVWRIYSFSRRMWWRNMKARELKESNSNWRDSFYAIWCIFYIYFLNHD